MFLESPRYSFGVLGFMTTERTGEKVLKASAVLSIAVVVLAGVRYLAGSIALDRLGQAIFLVVAAWLMVFGLMRIVLMGFLFVLSAVLGIFEDAMPSAAGLVDFFRRGYGIVIEVFLIAGMFYVLLVGVGVSFGWLLLES